MIQSVWPSLPTVNATPLLQKVAKRISSVALFVLFGTIAWLFLQEWAVPRENLSVVTLWRAIVGVEIMVTDSSVGPGLMLAGVLLALVFFIRNIAMLVALADIENSTVTESKSAVQVLNAFERTKAILFYAYFLGVLLMAVVSAGKIYFEIPPDLFASLSFVCLIVLTPIVLASPVFTMVFFPKSLLPASVKSALAATYPLNLPGKPARVVSFATLVSETLDMNMWDEKSLGFGQMPYGLTYLVFKKANLLPDLLPAISSQRGTSKAQADSGEVCQAA